MYHIAYVNPLAEMTSQTLTKDDVFLNSVCVSKKINQALSL